MQRFKSNHLRHAHCANCFSNFNINTKDSSKLYGKNSPYILKCGHSQCEKCIRESIKLNEKITCKICSRELEYGNLCSLENFRNEFPLNLFLTGSLFLRQNNKVPDKLMSVPKLSLKTHSEPDVKYGKCFECTENPSDVSCKECNHMYCNMCFDSVHKKARALQSHTKLSIEKGAEKLTLEEYCEIHTEQKIDIYCSTCNVSTCSYCAIGSHLGHFVYHKESVNKKKLKAAEENVEKLKSLCKRYQYFRQKVAVDRNVCSDLFSSTEKKITSHFDQLHALLQLKEIELLQHLLNYKVEIDESRLKVIENLDVVIQEFQSVVNVYSNAQSSNNMALLDVDEIVQQIHRAISKPIYVGINIPEDTDQENCDDICSINNESILTILKEHFTLKDPALRKYSLLFENDVPDDYIVEESPIEDQTDSLILSSKDERSSVSSSCNTLLTDQSSKSNNLYQSAESIGFKSVKKTTKDTKKNMRKTSANSVNSAAKENVSDFKVVSDSKVISEPRFKSNFIVNFKPGDVETIKICHFLNPSNFFVQTKGSVAELDLISNEVKKMRLDVKECPSEVFEGKIYLVKYIKDNKWYRGRVEKMENIERILISYIDYGNTEYVNIDRLRNVSQKFSIIPPIAVNCALYDCYPIGGEEWSTEAIKLMISIISGNNLLMHVMRADDGLGKLEVDLTKFEEDSRLSIRDSLIFYELGYFVISNSVSNDVYKMKNRYYTSKNVCEGQIIDVIVTNVINPTNLYVRALEKNHSFKNVCNQMNDYYNNSHRSSCGVVYSPYIGLLVAVTDGDHNWKRGKVVNLPGNRQVEVFLVDTGETKTVPWLNIRMLQNRFLYMSVQALKCSLADIIPPNQLNYWPEQSIESFKKLVCYKRFKATICGVSADCYKIALYECGNSVDTNVNAFLVQSGHAESVGIISTIVEFSNNQISELSKYQGKIKKQLPRMQIVQKDNMDSSCPNKINDDETYIEDKETGRLKLPSTLIKFIDPGNFFISFNFNKKLTDQLFKNMNEFYTSKNNIKSRSINQGDLCAAYNETDNQWYRACVTNVQNDDTYEVYLKDIASTIVVNISALAPIDEAFKNIQDVVYKCRLAGISAAGGQKNRWPEIASEVFKEFIKSDNKIYITQRGNSNPDSESIPVEFWIKSIVEGGPLEPLKEEWCCINNVLIDKGVALPEKGFVTPFEKSKEDNIKKKILLDKDKPANRCEQTIPSNECCDNNLENPKGEHSAENIKEQSIDSDNLQTTGQHSISSDSSQIISDWLSAVPLVNSNFIGIPTYVNDNFDVFVQDSSSSSVLDIISRALMSRYNKSKPKSHDLYWFPGQLCIAQYHGDRKWYRAKVLELNSDNTLTVEMVDYGNIEICKAAELRKNICMEHIPKQVHKCSFNQIQPISENGKWPVAVLDFVHGTIVDKPCQIEISGELGSYNILSIKCPGDLDLAHILISMNYAELVINNEDINDNNEDDCTLVEVDIDNEIILSESSNNSDLVLDKPITSDLVTTLTSTQDNIISEDNNIENHIASEEKVSWYEMVIEDEKKKSRSYKSIQLPDDITEFFGEVICIHSPTSLTVHISHENVDCLAKNVKEFVVFQEKLQEIAENQPTLTNIKKGDACICKYSADGNWYRALVNDTLANGKYDVKFVDYGNYEITFRKNIRELNVEWYDVPLQSLQCSLWGLKISDPSKDTECLKKLDECLSNQFIIKIKERSPDLTVELYEHPGSCLIYQKLIDDNVYNLTVV